MHIHNVFNYFVDGIYWTDGRADWSDIKFADFSWAADRTIKLEIYNFIDQCNLIKLNQRR